MVNKGVITSDIDGVLIQIAPLWHKWLSDRFEPNEEEVAKWRSSSNGLRLPYNLSKLYNIPEGMSGFDFWKDLRLYDTLKPDEQAVEYLWKLKEEGYEITYASKCSGEHESSKFRFIKRNFPYDAVLFTWEKQYIQTDFMIDDSSANLQKFIDRNHNAELIHFKTDYVEEGLFDIQKMLPVWNWKEIYEYIKWSKL